MGIGGIRGHWGLLGCVGASGDHLGVSEGVGGLLGAGMGLLGHVRRHWG